MARVVQDFGEQRIRGPHNEILYKFVYRLDCGCSMEVDRQTIYQERYDSLMDLVERAAAAHACGIVFTARAYDTVRGQRRPERIPWNRESLTFMGVPISAPERALREFYSAPYPPPARPASNPLGFKPEQLDALKAKPPELSKKLETKLDRFDLIEID